MREQGPELTGHSFIGRGGEISLCHGGGGTGRRWPTSQEGAPQNLDLGLPASRAMRYKFCCLSCPVCAPPFWQLERTAHATTFSLCFRPSAGATQVFLESSEAYLGSHWWGKGALPQPEATSDHF